MTLLGREVWKLILGFSWVSPHVPVLFTDFNLCPFIVVKYSYEYNSFSSIVSPSSDEPEGCPGKPQHKSDSYLTLHIFK